MADAGTAIWRRDDPRRLARSSHVKIRSALVLAVVVLAGCGDNPTGTSEATTSRTPATGSWTPLVALAELGSFETHCGRRAGKDVFATRFTVNPMTATSTVSLSIDGGRASRRVLQPGQHWATTLAPTRSQTWRITQATEPQTIAATVRITPSRCPYGVPGTSIRYGTARFNSR
jgi:hypothetical protein